MKIFRSLSLLIAVAILILPVAAGAIESSNEERKEPKELNEFFRHAPGDRGTDLPLQKSLASWFTDCQQHIAENAKIKLLSTSVGKRQRVLYVATINQARTVSHIQILHSSDSAQVNEGARSLIETTEFPHLPTLAKNESYDLFFDFYDYPRVRIKLAPEPKANEFEGLAKNTSRP